MISDIAATLRASYGLAVCRERDVSLIARGYLNRNYHVNAASRVYCLKVYSPGLYTPDRIRRACELQEAVRRAGVPTPAVLPNADGDTVTEMADTFCVLYEFATGRHYDRPQIPAAAARELGRTLGQLHLALAELEPPRPYLPPDPEAALARLEAGLAAAERRRSGDPVDETCCQVLRYKVGALQRHSGLRGGLAALSTQLVHRDYQETNLLFDPADRVVAVLDFDGVGHQPRGAEVMRALTLCFLHEGQLLPEAEQFLAGYFEVARPPAEEAALFAPLFAYTSFTGAWPILDRYEKPEHYQPRWDRFIASPDDWWERNLEWLAERLVELARGCA